MPVALAACIFTAVGGHLVSSPTLRPPAFAPRAAAAQAVLSEFDDGHGALTPSEYTAALLADEAEVGSLMEDFGLSAQRPLRQPQRGVFCTRALDMRSIKGIGYDMDYTLIDYKMVLLEERVYHYSITYLRSKGFPVGGLEFAPELVVRGLIVDTLHGHTLKVDRFGYVRRAMHGTRVLSADEIAETYGSGPPIDLRNSRWKFLNTLFSVSEGCLYAQLVDRLDSGQLYSDSREPFDAERCATYEQLYKAVSKALFTAHVQSKMKEEIMQEPLRFVNVDPEYTATLLDQRAAGKKLALITNSDWIYTNTMMHATYDPFLPEGMRWADLFDVVVVSACKPEFFSMSRRPVYEIATADGFLREGFEFTPGHAYAGGNAKLVERCFGVSGPEMLYVGDHLFTDVNMAKRGLMWRTCLILQELENEMAGLGEGAPAAQKLTRLLRKKDLQAAYVNHLRSQLLHLGRTGGLASLSSRAKSERAEVLAAIESLESEVAASEAEIATMVALEGNHVNQYWGYMSRAGFSDKSHLMRQIEKYADIYTSRVANLLPYTPYKQFLCQRQSLAHSTSSYSGRPLMEHWQIQDATRDAS